jgi:hypothetical protein
MTDDDDVVLLRGSDIHRMRTRIDILNQQIIRRYAKIDQIRKQLALAEYLQTAAYLEADKADDEAEADDNTPTSQDQPK